MKYEQIICLRIIILASNFFVCLHKQYPTQIARSMLTSFHHIPELGGEPRYKNPSVVSTPKDQSKGVYLLLYEHMQAMVYYDHPSPEGYYTRRHWMDKLQPPLPSVSFGKIQVIVWIRHRSHTCCPNWMKANISLPIPIREYTLLIV